MILLTGIKLDLPSYHLRLNIFVYDVQERYFYETVEIIEHNLTYGKYDKA